MTAICIGLLNSLTLVFGDEASRTSAKTTLNGYWLYISIAIFFVMLIFFLNKFSLKGKGTNNFIFNKILNIDNLRNTFKSMGSGLIATDKDGRVIYINPAAEMITGYNKTSARGQVVNHIFRLLKIGSDSISVALEDILKDQMLQDSMILTNQNGICNVTTAINSIFDNSGTHLGFIFVIHDLSSFKKEESLLRKNEEKYRKLYNQAEYSMLLLDSHVITDCNTKAVGLFGCSKEQLIGKSIYDLTFDLDGGKTQLDNQLKLRISDTLHGTPQYFEWVFNCLNDTRLPVEISLKQVTFNGSEMVQATIYGLSNTKHVVDPDQVKSDYDCLTKLANRKNFYNHLNLAITDCEHVGNKLAVLFIDLDLFKNINDTLGHDIGDALLQQAANRIATASSKDTAIVARMGGDEFAVLLTAVESEEYAPAAAKNMLDQLSKPFIIDDHELFLTASIGVALYPGHGKDTHSILKNAASSMYKAKTGGRNNYQIYTSDINENTMQKFNMQKSLRKALDRNELLLHYQPKVDGKSGALVGIEALIRWQHPEKGLIYPAEFIPLAEETGIIKQIDEWVLRTACNQLKKWTTEGHTSLRLAVNLSAWQFKEQHLADIVADVLTQTGIKPADLELEITETAAMENLDFTVNTLGKLMDMGVNISIDDFGTGYSSLNYLKHFPINFLKIDRTFVADILADKNTCAIVKAIIEVAHTLNLKVIAEGVETEDQLKLLRELGCDEIQGFYISKPLSVADLEKQIKIGS